MKVLFTCLLLAAAILVAQQVPSNDKPPVIRAITFHNMNPLTAADIRDRFHERDLRLAVENPYNADVVEQARTVLAELLTERKVPFKEVRAETSPVPPHSMEVKFTVIK
jgi:hypothetical protein